MIEPTTRYGDKPSKQAVRDLLLAKSTLYDLHRGCDIDPTRIERCCEALVQLAHRENWWLDEGHPPQSPRTQPMPLPEGHVSVKADAIVRLQECVIELMALADEDRVEVEFYSASSEVPTKAVGWKSKRGRDLYRKVVALNNAVEVLHPHLTQRREDG